MLKLLEWKVLFLENIENLKFDFLIYSPYKKFFYILSPYKIENEFFFVYYICTLAEYSHVYSCLMVVEFNENLFELHKKHLIMKMKYIANINYSNVNSSD